MLDFVSCMTEIGWRSQLVKTEGKKHPVTPAAGPAWLNNNQQILNPRKGQDTGQPAGDAAAAAAQCRG